MSILIFEFFTNNLKNNKICDRIILKSRKGSDTDMLETFADNTTKEIVIENNKALSSLCKHLISSGKDFTNINEVASALGITPQSFRNKLTRNSFSVSDLLVIADMVGANLKVHLPESVIQLELRDFLDDDTYNQYQEYKKMGKQHTISEIMKLTQTLSDEEREQVLNAFKGDTGSK